MVRLQISLESIEANVLAKRAEAEMGDPREQIRFVLLQELIRHGLLEDSNCQEVQFGRVVGQGGGK